MAAERSDGGEPGARCTLGLRGRRSRHGLLGLLHLEPGARFPPARYGSGRGALGYAGMAVGRVVGVDCVR